MAESKGRGWKSTGEGATERTGDGLTFGEDVAEWKATGRNSAGEWVRAQIVLE